MRVMTILITAVGLTAPPVGAGAWAASAQAPEAESSIQGVWVLNSELSDDPRPVFQNDDARDQGRQGSSAGGGGFGGGRGGRGGGGGGGFGGSRGGDRPDPGEMAEMREAMQSAMMDLMTAARRMTVVETEREVLLTYGDGRALRLIPDDQEHAGIAGNSMRVTRRTKWIGERLVARIELQSRMKLTLEQTYELVLEGQQLVVTSKFEGDRFENDEARELRRVYDRES